MKIYLATFEQKAIMRKRVEIHAQNLNDARIKANAMKCDVDFLMSDEVSTETTFTAIPITKKQQEKQW